LNALENFGEKNSLHNVLRQMTENYIICHDCYKECKIPSSMSLKDFKAMTIPNMLG